MLRMRLQGALHAKPVAGHCVRVPADAALAGIYADGDVDAGAGNWRDDGDFLSDPYGDVEVAAGDGSGDAVSRGRGQWLLREPGAGGKLGAVSLRGVSAVPGGDAGV